MIECQDWVFLIMFVNMIKIVISGLISLYLSLTTLFRPETGRWRQEDCKYSCCSNTTHSKAKSHGRGVYIWVIIVCPPPITLLNYHFRGSLYPLSTSTRKFKVIFGSLSEKKRSFFHIYVIWPTTQGNEHGYVFGRRKSVSTTTTGNCT